MSNKSIVVTDPIYDYILSASLREPEVLKLLREETAHHVYSNMQIAPEQGQFMALLVELIGAKKILEVGVFTGYSSTSLALALPSDGHITACDISEDFTAVARRYWDQADVSDKIDLRLGPALDTLDSLIAEGRSGSYDLAFIDADKANYDGYYERTLSLLRVGGLLLVDNVLWNGKVVEDCAFDDADTAAIRALNEKIHADPRVTISLLPVADGLTLALKR
ncbi:MAG: class I SAM-dependent methyltransferase [Methylococcaceae bacterium]|nr:class I SAM-dependent methyltransferase [Methylococcaceae bacterium]MDZ4156811.1 class I SAM-dependent methyltransferase [Methylococcales bacterium]MDP2391721.1 class I SAM-dependent methyltransferase [Methylococcaceae bacterium]MDP3018395.1 class I SAM-dependent methyltransferase [Methylococcaceae bacterium]MDP3389437.1 class I SAM-dependent methyltransferase [Methylococcaceae bacterium]